MTDVHRMHGDLLDESGLMFDRATASEDAYVNYRILARLFSVTLPSMRNMRRLLPPPAKVVNKVKYWRWGDVKHLVPPE